jgi:hypothetical protein
VGAVGVTPCGWLECVNLTLGLTGQGLAEWPYPGSIVAITLRGLRCVFRSDPGPRHHNPRPSPGTKLTQPCNLNSTHRSSTESYRFFHDPWQFQILGITPCNLSPVSPSLDYIIPHNLCNLRAYRNPPFSGGGGQLLVTATSSSGLVSSHGSITLPDIETAQLTSGTCAHLSTRTHSIPRLNFCR